MANRRKYHFHFFLSSSIFNSSRTELISKLLFDAYDMDINKINQDDISSIINRINKKREYVEVTIYVHSENEKSQINVNSPKLNLEIW